MFFAAHQEPVHSSTVGLQGLVRTRAAHSTQPRASSARTLLMSDEPAALGCDDTSWLLARQAGRSKQRHTCPHLDRGYVTAAPNTVSQPKVAPLDLRFHTHTSAARRRMRQCGTRSRWRHAAYKWGGNARLALAEPNAAIEVVAIHLSQVPQQGLNNVLRPAIVRGTTLGNQLAEVRRPCCQRLCPLPDVGRVHDCGSDV